MKQSEDLLRRLAANDEGSLKTVMSPRGHRAIALGQDTQALVQLSALLAVDAATASLCWAADMASGLGVDDTALAQVLLIVAPVAGSAQAAASAPRLALALGVDLEMGG